MLEGTVSKKWWTPAHWTDWTKIERRTCFVPTFINGIVEESSWVAWTSQRWDYLIIINSWSTKSWLLWWIYFEKHVRLQYTLTQYLKMSTNTVICTEQTWLSLHVHGWLLPRLYFVFVTRNQKKENKTVAQIF